MSFMECEITAKGRLYSGECAKCGATHFVHEWATWDVNGERDAMQAGTLACPTCRIGRIDPETFRDCGRQYAGRYSANGYMDCTDWSYGANKRKLESELRDMYGDDE